MIITGSINQIDAIIVLGVPPAGGAGGDVAVLHHVGHLEVSGDLVDTVLSRGSFLALSHVILS